MIDTIDIAKPSPVIDISQLQAIVYAAVEARGYTDNLTQTQFVAKQIAKLQEELAEFADFCKLPVRLQTDIICAGEQARRTFDMPRAWAMAYCFDRDAACKELADIAIVVLCAAEALRFDVLDAALLKATQDIGRGVRNGNG